MSSLLGVHMARPSEDLLKAAGLQAPEAVAVGATTGRRPEVEAQEPPRALPKTRGGRLTMLHTPRSTRLGGKPCSPLVCSVARGAQGAPSGFGGWIAPASTRLHACASFLSFFFLAPRFHTWPQLLRRMHLCDSKRRKQGCGLAATRACPGICMWQVLWCERGRVAVVRRDGQGMGME